MDYKVGDLVKIETDLGNILEGEITEISKTETGKEIVSVVNPGHAPYVTTPDKILEKIDKYSAHTYIVVHKTPEPVEKPTRREERLYKCHVCKNNLPRGKLVYLYSNLFDEDYMVCPSCMKKVQEIGDEIQKKIDPLPEELWEVVITYIVH